jgi:hypothetical protein
MKKRKGEALLACGGGDMRRSHGAVASGGRDGERKKRDGGLGKVSARERSGGAGDYRVREGSESSIPRARAGGASVVLGWGSRRAAPGWAWRLPLTCWRCFYFYYSSRNTSTPVCCSCLSSLVNFRPESWHECMTRDPDWKF